MSTRCRFLMPALVLTAAVAVVGMSIPTVPAVGPRDTANAAALSHPRPLHRPPRTKPAPTMGTRAARFALREVGVPYQFGGESPRGFDCSGLVRWSYLHVGIDLPHSSYALFGRGRRVSRAHMQPGDVLFFDALGHVGLYVGHGRMVHAPYTGTNVQVVSLGRWSGHFDGARRIVAS
jgi:cell wall-associated NlpC family hydrolase